MLTPYIRRTPTITFYFAILGTTPASFLLWSADVNPHLLEDLLEFLRLIGDHTNDKFTGIDSC